MIWTDAGWWAWIPVTVVMVGFWTAVSWAVLTLVAGRRLDPGAGADALGILDERLARGEIDLDEYELRRAALRARALERR